MYRPCFFNIVFNVTKLMWSRQFCYGESLVCLSSSNQGMDWMWRANVFLSECVEQGEVIRWTTVSVDPTGKVHRCISLLKSQSVVFCSIGIHNIMEKPGPWNMCAHIFPGSSIFSSIEFMRTATHFQGNFPFSAKALLVCQIPTPCNTCFQVSFGLLSHLWCSKVRNWQETNKEEYVGIKVRKYSLIFWCVDPLLFHIIFWCLPTSIL